LHYQYNKNDILIITNIISVKKLSGGILAWLSWVKCRFAYGPADATVTHYLLLP